MIKTNNIDDIINNLNKKLKKSTGEKPVVVAIDGMSASGKTSLADILSKQFDIDVIHMDDFFLPLNLRTDNRLSEVGGNVHYERFKDEVVSHINEFNPLNYKIFDCSIMDFNGNRMIRKSNIRIVEGSYSQHPYFENYADIKIFCKISSEEQINRIINRNGAEKAIRFKNEWIPLENKYFESLDLKDNIIFSN